MWCWKAAGLVHVCIGMATVSAKIHTLGAQSVNCQDIHAPSLEQTEPLTGCTCAPIQQPATSSHLQLLYSLSSLLNMCTILELQLYGDILMMDDRMSEVFQVIILKVKLSCASASTIKWRWRCISRLIKNHAIKMYWGNGGTVLINLCTRWRWVVSFMPQLLYPRDKSP
jgi:hypothetical protein